MRAGAACGAAVPPIGRVATGTTSPSSRQPPLTTASLGKTTFPAAIRIHITPFPGSETATESFYFNCLQHLRTTAHFAWET